MMMTTKMMVMMVSFGRYSRRGGYRAEQCGYRDIDDNIDIDDVDFDIDRRIPQGARSTDCYAMATSSMRIASLGPTERRGR
jgi:hypothetical protein